MVDTGKDQFIIKKETMIKKNTLDIHSVYDMETGVSQSLYWAVLIINHRNWEVDPMVLYTKPSTRHPNKRELLKS